LVKIQSWKRRCLEEEGEGDEKDEEQKGATAVLTFAEAAAMSKD
jgi:hypothetical protein